MTRVNRRKPRARQVAELLLNVSVVVLALVLLVLLVPGGYNDWRGTLGDGGADESSKTIAFITMLSEIALGIAVLAAALALVAWQIRRTDRIER